MIFLFSAGTTAASVLAGGTGTAATAAGTFSLFLILDHTPDDQRNDQHQNSNYNNITHAHSGHLFLNIIHQLLHRYQHTYSSGRSDTAGLQALQSQQP